MKENVNFIVNALKGCESRERVEELFSKYEVEDNTQKISLLKKAMGSPTFYSTSEMTPDVEIHRMISILLTGNWKVNELYSRAGL